MVHERLTLPGATSLATQAAMLVAQRAGAVAADHGRFTLGVSGGRTPWESAA
jgi:6-phosphogluconolactonase/glucosamine-6-phosphate isomerase/deaminase